MKRVLYVTNLPAPYKIDFFDLLSEKVDLTVLYERKNANNRHALWAKEKANRYVEDFLNGKNIGNESSMAFSIISYLKKSYDVVLLNGYSSPTMMLAICYLRFHHTKFGIVCDGMLEKKDHPLKKLYKSFLINSASFWLGSNEMTCKELVKYGADKKHIYLYPFSSVLKKDVFSLSEMKLMDKKIYKKMIECDSEKMVLYVGQLIHRKGIDTLVKAFNDLSGDVSLYLVGGTVEELQSLISIHDSRIHTIDFKKKEELMDYYLAADVFVLPTREDIWGLVVNEAMAYGLPVITTNKCGAGDAMVEDGVNGYTIHPDSVDELKQALELVLSKDPHHYLSQSLSTAEIYTIDHMASCVSEVIDREG